jgi:hypothetical protein
MPGGCRVLDSARVRPLPVHMPIEFRVSDPLVGFTAAAVKEGDLVDLITRELVAPSRSAHLLDRLERLQGALFHLIPGMPSPSIIDHLLVVIHSDLSAVAYINELNITARVKPKRPIPKGEPIMVRDIDEITSIDLGVPIPHDAAIVLVRSHSWRKSLFYDFAPLNAPPIVRDYPLDRVLAQQALLLLGLIDSPEEAGSYVRQLDRMKRGLDALRELIQTRCNAESQYQELLQANPWMLGGIYKEVLRHRSLDDARIRDFTALRSYDGMHDIVEIKQPFLQLFRKDGGFTAAFHDAWNQVESYLTFVHRHRAYLRDEKKLHFENARCTLILGSDLTDDERRAIREKEILYPAVTVLTYQELVQMAENLVQLMEVAQQAVASDVTA